MRKKSVIILEGADACGKTQLSKFIQDKVNGKCHILHSNYDKHLPNKNNYKQHKLMAKFVNKQFDFKYAYTGNDTVILDRNFISDIVYGKIGYGSDISENKKFILLKKLINKLSNNVNCVYIIYCKPTKSKFDTDSREELLDNKENSVIQQEYDKFFSSAEFLDIVHSNEKVVLYNFNFEDDGNYKQISKVLF